MRRQTDYLDMNPQFHIAKTEVIDDYNALVSDYTNLLQELNIHEHVVEYIHDETELDIWDLISMYNDLLDLYFYYLGLENDSFNESDIDEMLSLFDDIMTWSTEDDLL